MAGPVATADSWFISNTTAVLPAELLLGNDSDADGDALSVTAVLNPTNGVVSLVNGIISFTPSSGAATASFGYTVDDGTGSTATGTVAVTIVTTSFRNDVLTVPDTADFSFVNGWGGVDRLTGHAGPDTLIGGDRWDLLDGGDGNDTLVTGRNGGRALGGASDDLIDLRGEGNANDGFGGEGNDTIYGGHFSIVDGGPGADEMHGVKGAYAYVDDPGDVLIGHFKRVYVSVPTFETDTQRTIFLQDGAVEVTGGALRNKIFGNDADNRLSGEERPDQLFGAAGDDTLDGGSGRDHLFGGNGADSLIGGTNADVFAYASASESGPGAGSRDVIADFNQGSDPALYPDRIDLVDVDANAGATGNQAFAFIGDAAFTGAAGQLRCADGGADKLVQGDVDGDGHADLEILLQGDAGLAIGAGSFVL